MYKIAVYEISFSKLSFLNWKQGDGIQMNFMTWIFKRHGLISKKNERKFLGLCEEEKVFLE